MKGHSPMLLIWAFLQALFVVQCVKPTQEISLYPNTQDSPSLYLIGFSITNEMQTNEYLLINMDWLSTPADPYHCILVNTSLSIRCTNFDTPEFPISFDQSMMGTHNPQLLTKYDKCILIELLDPISPNTEYILQIALINDVENINRFSTSAQFYCLTTQGLVYEQNTNFGSVSSKPAVSINLNVDVLTDLTSNVPGSLSSLRAQIAISVPITTSSSALLFILEEPFKFSESSYYQVEESEKYGTNSIPLYAAPQVQFYEVKTPNIFYLVFKEKFTIGREFIVKITQIQNPFQISVSNISIYSANFNSLTPLEEYSQGYGIYTVTQQLSLILGIPHDMPLSGPCVFHRSRQNFYKITFNMPLTVPAGYSIKLYIDQNTIIPGTAFINFQSLSYTTKYEYFTSYIIMSQMGPILKGSLIFITFKATNNGASSFYVDVSIDTEQIISSGVSQDFMFYGRADSTTQVPSSILIAFQDNIINDAKRVTAYLVPPQLATDYTSFELVITYYSFSGLTSSGSYTDIYLSPEVELDAAFVATTDCRFDSLAFGTCISTPNKTSQFLHLKIVGSTDYLTNTNTNPFGSTRTMRIRNIRFPQISTNKYPYQTYFRIFNSSIVNPTTYIDTSTITILPPLDALPNIYFYFYSNTYNLDYRYPGFLRFQCSDPNDMDFQVQENQKRVLTVMASLGFRGLDDIGNQKEYPCMSNIDIECFYHKGRIDSSSNQYQWDRVHIFFPTNEETANKFHIIVPYSSKSNSWHYFSYSLGVYNTLTKDYKYYYRGTQRQKAPSNPNSVNSKPNLMVDFQGKAGSYRKNVTITVDASSIPNGVNFLVISSAWSLFQKGISLFSATYTNPTFRYQQRSPVSVAIGSNMYMTVIPFQCSGCSTTFSIQIDNLHMPYHYDLPNYYIYIFNPSGDMTASNQFEMTNGGIFYQAYLNSLTMRCSENYLGVQNTECQIVFGTHSPLKADANITIVFSGMNIATDICDLVTGSGQTLESECQSTEDNKNVSIWLLNPNKNYHYPSSNYTLKIKGISIEADKISQSITTYVHDSTGKYVIQKGTRIFTTTVARPESIEISEIVYSYSSPLSSNKMSLSFSLPRVLYDDERLGFIVGKDLSDVNLQIKRLKIIIIRSADGYVIENTNEMISSEYKILFTLKDRSELVVGTYQLEIYGIMTPASHENGAFSIIYQRNFDKAYTLTNLIETTFPSFNQLIVSDISMQAYFNAEGQSQKIVFTITNKVDVVNDQMIWIVNFPSYYSQSLFNAVPYCMIDNAPIQCYADPTTPYQMIIKNSPKIIQASTLYTLSIFKLASPRSVYTGNVYPSRYIFIGILTDIDNEYYSERALIYPQQNIQPFVSGTLTITDMSVSSTLTSFSTVYLIIKFICNVIIPANSILFINFPEQFDNFNNKQVSFIFKKVSTSEILNSGVAKVNNRMLYFQITQSIAINTAIVLEIPTLPTPRSACSVQMSDTLSFITSNDQKSVIAATAISSNSAPILTFVQDPRYISFNYDNTIEITTGTFSSPIDVTSSDGEQFLTNIRVNLTSTGFTFEPSSIFLKLGDSKGQFRVGADMGLLPISYTYSTIKTQQVFTYYAITKNNNIKVTNKPVEILSPANIDIPAGGCSTPYIIELNNPPVDDFKILFDYDNEVYNEDLFWPNQHITGFQLDFNSSVIKNFISFCTSPSIQQKIENGQISETFYVNFVASGTNYASYTFVPETSFMVNLIPSTTLPVPTIQLEVTNQQKNFLSFNITTNTKGIIYYHFKIGTENDVMDDEDIKILIKKSSYIMESMEDYMTRIYLSDRDERIGLILKNEGEETVTFHDLLPERLFSLCVYLENENNAITDSKCIESTTQEWGPVKKASIKFNYTLSEQELNKVLCFFAKQVDTETIYLVDLQGNSCQDNQPANAYFKYPGQTFTHEQNQTHIYLFTNPYISSDPSATAFDDLFGPDFLLTSASQAAAISNFAIDYTKATYISSSSSILMLETQNADSMKVSFNKPVFDSSTETVTVSNIQMTGQGTVYFGLYLYKEIVLDGNNSYVSIRLGTEPTKEQILNCENWESLPAEGCARAVFSETSVEVTFRNVKSHRMYLLYYLAASQYPLRPIVATRILNDTIVTFSFQKHTSPTLLLVLLLLMSFLI